MEPRWIPPQPDRNHDGERSMTRTLTGTLLALVFATGAQGATRTYTLPDETAELASGPNLETVQGNCAACHSSDYISTQPRGLADPRAFWAAEVTKMKHAYGAPVEDADMAKIVEYLVQIYGK